MPLTIFPPFSPKDRDRDREERGGLCLFSLSCERLPFPVSRSQSHQPILYRQLAFRSAHLETNDISLWSRLAHENAYSDLRRHQHHCTEASRDALHSFRVIISFSFDNT